jgi:hypothetical protein
MKQIRFLLFVFIASLFPLAGLAQQDTLRHDAPKVDSLSSGEYRPKPHPRPREPEFNILDKLYYGGNLGFNFSNIGYFANVSPLVGYHITPKFSAGVTVTYMYYEFHTPYGTLKNSIYGGGIFARYFIFENIFAHAEIQALNGEWVDGNRFNLYPFLVGGGYRGRITERASFFTMILYDLNYSIYSPSSSPISITFGFGVGF